MGIDRKMNLQELLLVLMSIPESTRLNIQATTLQMHKENSVERLADRLRILALPTMYEVEFYRSWVDLDETWHG